MKGLPLAVGDRHSPFVSNHGRDPGGYTPVFGSRGLPGWNRLVGYVVGLPGVVLIATAVGYASSGCGPEGDEVSCVDPTELAVLFAVATFVVLLVAIVVWELLLRDRVLGRDRPTSD